MSAKLVGSVLENPEWFETRGEMLVMIQLADSASAQNGYSCWMGVERLAERAKLTKRGCRKILRSLEEKGLIETKYRTGSTNIYVVKTDGGEELSSGGSEFRRNGSSPKPLLYISNNTTEDEGREEGSSKTGKGTAKAEGEEYGFEEFWNDYGKKVGKVRSEKEWKKLKEGDRKKIRAHVGKYVAATAKKKGEGKVLRLDPERYLKYRRFEDEEIPEVWGKEEKRSERLMTHAEAIAYRDRVLGSTGDGNPKATKWDAMFETVKSEEGTRFKLRAAS